MSGKDKPYHTHVGEERSITHYQEAFPKDHLMDVSVIFPVEKQQSGNMLAKITAHAQKLIKEAAEKNEYPLSYAIYVRYFKGTNGGLSTSGTTESQRTMAFEMVSDPTTPGYLAFRDEMIRYMKDELGLRVGFHWGKYIPEGETYATVNPVGAEKVKTILEQWHADPSDPNKKMSIKHNPFITPYDQNMLGYADAPALEQKPKMQESTTTTKQHVKAFQQYVTELHEVLPDHQKESCAALFVAFNKQCQQAIHALPEKAIPILSPITI